MDCSFRMKNSISGASQKAVCERKTWVQTSAGGFFKHRSGIFIFRSKASKNHVTLSQASVAEFLIDSNKPDWLISPLSLSSSLISSPFDRNKSISGKQSILCKSGLPASTGYKLLALWLNWLLSMPTHTHTHTHILAHALLRVCAIRNSQKGPATHQLSAEVSVLCNKQYNQEIIALLRSDWSRRHELLEISCERSHGAFLPFNSAKQPF